MTNAAAPAYVREQNTLTYRIKRVHSKRAGQRWRWDVWTWQGTPDRGMEHISSDCGYTWTLRGAAIAAARFAREVDHA